MALSIRQQQAIGQYVQLIAHDLRRVIGRIDMAAEWRAVQTEAVRAEIDAVLPPNYITQLRAQLSTVHGQIEGWLDNYLGDPPADPVTAQEEALNAERDARRAAETARIQAEQEKYEATYRQEAAEGRHLAPERPA